MYICVLCKCICSQKAEEDVYLLEMELWMVIYYRVGAGTGATDGYILLCGCWKLNLEPLQEQQVT